MSTWSTIKFPQVLAHLVEQRYRRNRAVLASAANITPSALSQYVRGRATPSLSVLVSLARALDVSLDYLVYGQDASEEREPARWAQHLDDTVRRMTSETASLRQLVDRVGINLSDQIHEVATELVMKTGVRGGALTATEVAQIERYSSCTRVASIDFNADVLLQNETWPEAVAAPGPFASVIAENISAGNNYIYIISDSALPIRRARLIAQEVKKTIDADQDSSLSNNAMVRHLQFYVATDGLVPSYVIYTLDRTRMAKEKPLLHDLVEGFLGVEHEIGSSNDDSYNLLALISPPNPGFDLYPLISRENLPALVKGFENLRRQSDRLSFIDINSSEGQRDGYG